MDHEARLFAVQEEGRSGGEEELVERPLSRLELHEASELRAASGEESVILHERSAILSEGGDLQVHVSRGEDGDVPVDRSLPPDSAEGQLLSLPPEERERLLVEDPRVSVENPLHFVSGAEAEEAALELGEGELYHSATCGSGEGDGRLSSAIGLHLDVLGQAEGIALQHDPLHLLVNKPTPGVPVGDSLLYLVRLGQVGDAALVDIDRSLVGRDSPLDAEAEVIGHGVSEVQVVAGASRVVVSIGRGSESLEVPCELDVGVGVVLLLSRQALVQGSGEELGNVGALRCTIPVGRAGEVEDDVRGYVAEEHLLPDYVVIDGGDS